MKSKSVLPLSIQTKDTSSSKAFFRNTNTQRVRFWLNQSVRNALEGKALVIWSWLVLCEGKRASSLTTNHWHHCVPLGHLLCARDFGFFAPNMTDDLSSGVNQTELVSACGLSILALDMHPKTGVSSVRSMTPKSGNVLVRHSMSGSQKRWDERWWDVLAFQTTLNYLDTMLALKRDCWRPWFHQNAPMIFPILVGIALPALPSGEIVPTMSLRLFNTTLLLTKSVGEYRRLNVWTWTPMIMNQHTAPGKVESGVNLPRPSHQTGCASITIQGDANGGIRFPRSGVRDPCHLQTDNRLGEQ